jgi:hypothetical protein
MLKGLLCSVAMLGLIATSSAFAESAAQADCTDANMMNANAAVAKLPAGDNKTMAMKEMDMAKDSRGRAKSEDCKLHLNKAIDISKSK